jgi:hypothetical protein
VRWLSTLELPAFDTPDGLLGEGQYALAGVRRDGTQQYWMRRQDDTRKVMMHPYIEQAAAVPDRATLVAVVGTLVVSEWLEDDGTITREVDTAEKLERLRTVADEPMPTKRAA